MAPQASCALAPGKRLEQDITRPDICGASSPPLGVAGTTSRKPPSLFGSPDALRRACVVCMRVNSSPLEAAGGKWWCASVLLVRNVGSMRF